MSMNIRGLISHETEEGKEGGSRRIADTADAEGDAGKEKQIGERSEQQRLGEGGGSRWRRDGPRAMDRKIITHQGPEQSSSSWRTGTTGLVPLPLSTSGGSGATSRSRDNELDSVSREIALMANGGAAPDPPPSRSAAGQIEMDRRDRVESESVFRNRSAARSPSHITKQHRQQEQHAPDSQSLQAISHTGYAIPAFRQPMVPGSSPAKLERVDNEFSYTTDGTKHSRASDPSAKLHRTPPLELSLRLPSSMATRPTSSTGFGSRQSDELFQPGGDYRSVTFASSRQLDQGECTGGMGKANEPWGRYTEALGGSRGGSQARYGTTMPASDRALGLSPMKEAERGRPIPDGGFKPPMAVIPGSPSGSRMAFTPEIPMPGLHATSRMMTPGEQEAYRAGYEAGLAGERQRSLGRALELAHEPAAWSSPDAGWPSWQVPKPQESRYMRPSLSRPNSGLSGSEGLSPGSSKRLPEGDAKNGLGNGRSMFQVERFRLPSGSVSQISAMGFSSNGGDRDGEYAVDKAPAYGGSRAPASATLSRSDRSGVGSSANSNVGSGVRAADKQHISCNVCRARKSRCDGTPPSACGPCVRRGTSDKCVYVDRVRRRGPGKKRESENASEANGDDSMSVVGGAARGDDDSPDSQRWRVHEEDDGPPDLKRRRYGSEQLQGEGAARTLAWSAGQ